jgi:hypothetical protein
MAGFPVLDSGNYDLQIATGFIVDGFTLDSSLRGLLNDPLYVLDGTTEFASVIESTTNIAVKRGRKDIGDQFNAGTLTCTILDVDGVFNPFDDSSPFYNTPDSQPGLAPMRKIRFMRYDDLNVEELLFTGYVVNYDYNFGLGEIDTVTVYCADQFYLLAQTYLNDLNVDPETSGERIETILNLPEVAFPVLARDIATGTVNLGHDASYNINAGTNALQYITQINETSEFGRVFMSRSGVMTFQDRIGATLSPLIPSIPMTPITKGSFGTASSARTSRMKWAKRREYSS